MGEYLASPLDPTRKSIQNWKESIQEANVLQVEWLRVEKCSSVYDSKFSDQALPPGCGPIRDIGVEVSRQKDNNIIDER